MNIKKRQQKPRQKLKKASEKISFVHKFCVVFVYLNEWFISVKSILLMLTVLFLINEPTFLEISISFAITLILSLFSLILDLYFIFRCPSLFYISLCLSTQKRKNSVFLSSISLCLSSSTSLSINLSLSFLFVRCFCFPSHFRCLCFLFSLSPFLSLYVFLIFLYFSPLIAPLHSSSVCIVKYAQM